ncbi:unnamed protein product [Musa hybrid cultivar]
MHNTDWSCSKAWSILPFLIQKKKCMFSLTLLSRWGGCDFALGTQKKVAGEVIRWNKITGPEKMDAVKFIEYLEAEIEELNRQVARKLLNGHNELLEYLKTLEPQNLKTSVTETSAPELANLLFWLMVVGYSSHNIEVFFDMERIFGAPPGKNV